MSLGVVFSDAVAQSGVPGGDGMTASGRVGLRVRWHVLAGGGAEVINRFGGSCADCHSLAEPQFDFVCEADHGCEPLPIDDAVIESVQAADPRPPRS
jgi:hypothetical protein